MTPPPCRPFATAETGTLQLLQWYNLTCNECGGKTSARCLNATSCALPDGNCSCPSTTVDVIVETPSEPLRRLAQAGEGEEAPSEQLRQLAQAGEVDVVVEEEQGTCSYANFT